jgi:hypothetical protein
MLRGAQTHWHGRRFLIDRWDPHVLVAKYTSISFSFTYRYYQPDIPIVFVLFLDIG